MKTRKLFIIFVSLSIFFAIVFASNIGLLGRAPSYNATGISKPTTSVPDLNSIISIIPWIASVIGALLTYLKDRHWQRKYKDVVVTIPLGVLKTTDSRVFSMLGEQ